MPRTFSCLKSGSVVGFRYLTMKSQTRKIPKKKITGFGLDNRVCSIRSNTSTTYVNKSKNTLKDGELCWVKPYSINKLYIIFFRHGYHVGYNHHGYGYEHEYGHHHGAPIHHPLPHHAKGYVPVYGPGYHDHIAGYAHGQKWA